MAGSLFFAFGFDRRVIQILARSFDSIPGGAYALTGSGVEAVARLGSGIFLTGLQLAHPGTRAAAVTGYRVRRAGPLANAIAIALAFLRRQDAGGAGIPGRYSLALPAGIRKVRNGHVQYAREALEPLTWPDQGQRTEKPTKRKLDKARREGQFPSSREFLAALQFLTFTVLLGAGGLSFLERVRVMARHFLEAAFRVEITQHSVPILYRQSVGNVFQPLLWVGACLSAVALAGQLGVTRLGVSLNKLAPDVKRMNPLEKVKNLPSQNFASLFQAIVFLPLLALAVCAVVGQNLAAYTGLVRVGLGPALVVVGASLKNFLWKAAFLFLAIGILDFIRVTRRHNKSLRMTKQEMRDEFKETEGNPQMKRRVRRIQRDLARRNMMKEVPKATAVIVNPTHYSVAIRYEMESMAAPRVVAKGKNYLALRIRQIATEHDVPIIENQPLAQALYKSADVGQEIPAHLYRAVAEVLAYIFKLMHRGGNRWLPSPEFRPLETVRLSRWPGAREPKA